MTRLVDNLLFAVFTVIYFVILTKILALFTAHFVIAIANILDIFGLLASLIIALVLANLTVKKNKRRIPKISTSFRRFL